MVTHSRILSGECHGQRNLAVREVTELAVIEAAELESIVDTYLQSNIDA